MKGFKLTLISAIAIGLLAGPAMGVAAQDEPAAEIETPIYFAWTAGNRASSIDGDFDESTGEMRGQVDQGIQLEASDPRFSGLGSVALNGNVENSTNGSAQLESRTYRIVMDGGEWTGSGTFVVAGDPSVPGPPAIVREVAVLTGEGAYEGMVMFMTGDYREAAAGEAVIIRVAVPPVPDVPDVPVE